MFIDCELVESITAARYEGQSKQPAWTIVKFNSQLCHADEVGFFLQIKWSYYLLLSRCIFALVLIFNTVYLLFSPSFSLKISSPILSSSLWNSLKVKEKK